MDDKIEDRYGREMRRRYEDLYVEVISGRMHARIEYRRRLFNRIREICNGMGVTMGLCMEFEAVNGQYRGLNREFMFRRAGAWKLRDYKRWSMMVGGLHRWLR